jgi:hypothetical protein
VAALPSPHRGCTSSLVVTDLGDVDLQVRVDLTDVDLLVMPVFGVVEVDGVFPDRERHHLDDPDESRVVVHRLDLRLEDVQGEHGDVGDLPVDADAVPRRPELRRDDLSCRLLDVGAPLQAVGVLDVLEHGSACCVTVSEPEPGRVAAGTEPREDNGRGGIGHGDLPVGLGYGKHLEVFLKLY